MTLETLRSAVRFIVFGDSSNTQYENTDLDRNINLWYKTALSWILPINGDWQVNGSVATTDIEAGVRKYQIPTDILKLNEVYIKYGTSSEYVKATQRDPKNISVEPDQDTYGYYPETPEFDLKGDYIYIYTPETTIAAVTAGLKIHYQTEITELSSTSDEPNLAEPFEKLLIKGPAYDYPFIDSGKKRDLKREIYGDPTIKNDDGVKGDLQKHYATRSTVRRNKISPKVENYF